MNAEKKPPFLVQAIYSFKGQNNDELCFKKNDVITVTQVEDGGWWEGTLKGKTGWFPSNYVKDLKLDASPNNVLSKSNVDLVAQQSANRNVIIKDLIDSEKAHGAELENLVNKFLIPINCTGVLTMDEYNGLVSNINEIVEVHQNLMKSLIECSNRPSDQQRIGQVFLSSAVKMKQVHEIYCTTHPRAILILDKYRDDLNKVMEVNGASPPGILILIAGLSKPFRRLDKYSGILQELRRYMEESHMDRGDITRSICVYKDIATSCSTIRRQKELELQILNGGVVGWEGDELATLGEILRIGSVAIGVELKDRYLVLFSDTLLLLSVSNTMTEFVYEGKLPLAGISVAKLKQSGDSFKNAFEIKDLVFQNWRFGRMVTGFSSAISFVNFMYTRLVINFSPMIEEIIAICQTKEDQQIWVDEIEKQIQICQQSSSDLSSPLSIKGSNLLQTHNVAPKPPLHAVSSIPYVRLTAYFARLIRKKIVTRRVLKKLLYKEYINRYDTSLVVRRRVHRSEYTIFPEKATVACISSATDSEASEKLVRDAIFAGKVDSFSTDSNTSFEFFEKPVFRTTITMEEGSSNMMYGTEVKCLPNLAFEDLSKLADDVEVRYQLCGGQQTFQGEIRQSQPILIHEPISNLYSVGFKSFSIHCGNCARNEKLSYSDLKKNGGKCKARPGVERKYCSSYRIASPDVSSIEELSMLCLLQSPGGVMTKVEGNGSVLNNISVRSSDSGLADITSTSVVSPVRDAHNVTSDGSSNFEAQCTCTSPFDTTPYTSSTSDQLKTVDGTTAAVPLVDGIGIEEPAIYRSGMYAHWWLKTKIPADVLKALSPISPGRDSDTGKIYFVA